MTDRPWAGIAPDMADVLRPALATAVDRSIENITHRYPELGADIAGRYGVALRKGIEDALSRFLDLLGSDLPPLDTELTASFASFGAREDRRGRSLETLLAAYRDGARVAWQVFSGAALDREVSRVALATLAEAIFVYIDELSSASALGFAQAQLRHASERDLARRELASALLAGEAGTHAPRVRELAGRAGWRLPTRVAVAVLATRGVDARPPILHPEILVVDRGDEVQGIIPDVAIPGLARQFASIAGAGGADGDPPMRVFVGTVRTLGEAPLSLAHAQALRRLADRGLLGEVGPVVTAARHLVALVLHADRSLAEHLVAQELAPLEPVPPARREILATTLLCWLGQHGDRAATSRALGIHPQTVSYRLGELRRLFGAGLDDPARRLALHMALAAGPQVADDPAQ